MRLALFNDYRVGLVEDGRVFDVTAAVPGHGTTAPWSWMWDLIARFDERRSTLREAAGRAEPLNVEQVQFLPPVPQPGKIVAAAANYHAHHKEMSERQTRTGEPSAGTDQGEVFLKAPSSIVGPGATVQLPNVPGREVHYEAELGVIIGRKVKDVPEDRALDCVFGYTTLMDFTVRGKGDRSRRKSYDSFTPIGPWIVTADEIADPQALRLQLWRNGELRQDTSTQDMVYSTAHLIAYASTVMTLLPGDVLATGTPSGVGSVQGGDLVEIEVERVGRMAVSIQAANPSAPVSDPTHCALGIHPG